MGFSEGQVRAALRAGCLSAPEAANWLLQEVGEQQQQPPLILQEQQHHRNPPGAPDQRAMDAFNPPRQPLVVLSGPDAPRLSLRAPDPRLDLATEEPHGRVESQALAQREQLAQQLRAEKRNKRKEHELILQRIADDRRQVQVKAQLTQALPSTQSLPPSEVRTQQQQPHASEESGQCLLVVRLPTGASIREHFPADSPLETLHQHLLAQHPELSPSSSFLQTFPKRRFSPADFSSTLRDLGLTPSATLCLVDPPPSGSPHLDPQLQALSEGSSQLQAGEGGDLRSKGGLALVLHSPKQLPRGGPRQQPGGDGSRLGGPDFPEHHRWGWGQKLDSHEEPMEEGPLESMGQEVPGDEDEDDDLLPGFPHSLEGARRAMGFSHPWPAAGNRLSATGESGAESPELPLAVARAAERRLQEAATCGRESEEEEKKQRQQRGFPGTTTPPGRLHPAVPPLFQLSLQGTVALLKAPSKQYCSSLSALTPELAEHLLAHMARGGLLSPRSLRLFFGCPLQRLRLDCYPYATNELLRQLQAFPALRHLSLFSCSVITDQGLSVLQYLSQLQHLNLSACVKLTDKCLQFLKGLSRLSHLALDQTRVSDQGLAEFLPSAPPTLTHLSLNQTGITDSTLALLSQHAPHLWVLSLKQTGVTDVSALRHLGALQVLHLDGTPVNEASLQTLSSHPSLSSLTLSGVQSLDGNRALELISGLPLVHLSLPSRHTVTDIGLAALCRLSGLMELDLTDYTHVTDEGLRHLPQLSRLRRLSLCNTLVTDVGLQHVEGLALLEELRLDRLRVSSTGVARCIVRLPHLQVLSLASTPVGDTVARLGIARCKQLLKVNLSRTRLTDRGLCFLRHVPLIQLNFDGSGVTTLGVASLQAACPSLGSIRASHLRFLPPEEVSDEEGPS
ncbi:uncharacterized protein LOC121935558 isoform X2 [Sceloporus undulatus]|nr:uncharacterized protein LOC121935558 isoform X2 [Sceloporus undulatus]